MYLLHIVKTIFICLILTILVSFAQVDAFFWEELEQSEHFEGARRHYASKAREYEGAGKEDLVTALRELEVIFTHAAETRVLEDSSRTTLGRLYTEAGQALLQLYDQDAPKVTEEDIPTALLFKHLSNVEFKRKAVVGCSQQDRQKSLESNAPYDEEWMFLGLDPSVDSAFYIFSPETRVADPCSFYSRREIPLNLESSVEREILRYIVGESLFEEVIVDFPFPPRMLNKDTLRELSCLTQRDGVFTYRSSRPTLERLVDWAPNPDKEEILKEWKRKADENPFRTYLPVPEETDLVNARYGKLRLFNLLDEFFTYYITLKRQEDLNDMFPGLVSFYEGPFPHTVQFFENYPAPFFIYSTSQVALDKRIQELNDFKEQEQIKQRSEEEQRLKVVDKQISRVESYIEKLHSSGTPRAKLYLGVPPLCDNMHHGEEDLTKNRFSKEGCVFAESIFLDIATTECEETSPYHRQYLLLDMNNDKEAEHVASRLSGLFVFIGLDASVSKFLRFSENFFRAMHTLLAPQGIFIFDPNLEVRELDEYEEILRHIFSDVSYDPQGKLPFKTNYEIDEGLFRCTK